MKSILFGELLSRMDGKLSILKKEAKGLLSDNNWIGTEELILEFLLGWNKTFF